MKNKKKEKKKSKKIIKVLSKIFVIFLFIAIIFSIVFLSGIFSVKTIEISIDGENKDGENIQIAEIESLTGLSTGQNLFEISRGEIKTSILSNSYVESVQVSKKLNGTITIDVVEREIKYLINYAGSYIYIDNQGYILELNSETKDAPIILGTTTDFTSLAIDNEEKIDRLNDEDLEKLLVVNTIIEVSKNNDIDGLISRIDITDSKDYIVYLDSEGKTVYLGDCSNLNTRILYMKKIVEEESGIQGEIFINMDLNTGNVYFRESV